VQLVEAKNMAAVAVARLANLTRYGSGPVSPDPH